MVVDRRVNGGRRGGRPLGGMSTPRYAPACPPGQMRVKERMLSGNVVKIGSPKKFFVVAKQWKYFVL